MPILRDTERILYAILLSDKMKRRFLLHRLTDKQKQDVKKWLSLRPKPDKDFKCSIDISQLKTDGIMHIPDVFDLDKIEAAREELVRKVNLKEDLKVEEGYFSQIDHPLLNTREILPLVIHPIIVKIATAYFDRLPALTNVNLRISHPTEQPEFGNLFFHVDPRTPPYLKFFIYLNDVDSIEHGPFTYVKGSHKNKIKGWRDKENKRLPMDAMVRHYGKEAIMHMLGKAGDLIVADTTGFHRGTKVKSRDRHMITAHYCFHPEMFKGPPYTGYISKENWKQVPKSHRYLTDFINIVGEK